IIYSTSVMSMVKILELEESLKTNLEVYVNEMQHKLDLIKVFQESIKRDKFKTLEEKEEYMGNPLNSYPMLRRLNQDWPKWLRYLKLGISTKNIKEMESLLQSSPSNEDLQVAFKGMSRIEKFYNQHAEDLTKGFLLGKKFDSQMNSPDCVALGDFYYNQTQYSDSTHWYRMALRLHKFTEGKIYEKVLHLKRKRIYKKYAKAMVQETLKLDKKKAIAKNIPELEAMAKQVAREDNYQNIKRTIDELLTGKERIFQEEAARNKRKPSNLELGCRGKWPNKPSPTLTCRYVRETHDFLKLAPLKMEFLNMQPLIVIFHEVLYESEFKSMRDIAIFNATMGDGWTYVDFDKKGKPKRQDRVVKMITFQGTTAEFTLRINRRIADMTGLEMNENMVLHLTNYGLGGHFGKHVDYVELAKRPPNFFGDLGGDRIATALLYASDVPLGGTTVFTKLKLSIEPKKGSALIWFNLNNAGDPDPMSEHSACPVVLGSRWTISKWIHERQQLFKKPCFA
ncbi:hypothetical protein KR067_003070, partial [Drosophila pandora]